MKNKNIFYFSYALPLGMPSNMETSQIQNFMKRSIALLMLFHSLVYNPASLISQTVSAPENKYAEGVEMLKGTMFSSLSFSYSRRSAENDDQLIIYYVEQERHRFEVRLDPGYVVKKNLGVGLGLLYGTDQGNNIQQASDGTLSYNRFYENNYAVRPFVKSFLPLGAGKRFYVIIPAELQFGYGGRVNESTSNSILTRTFSETYYYGVALRPGLLAFIVDNFGFEISVGAFGLSSSIAKTEKTGQPASRVETNDINLAINILQLSLGFSLYIN